MDKGTWTVKCGLAQMLKGGVIMDVVTSEQAKIAEEAGACAVMALERVPADIRADGGVARMADPTVIEENANLFHSTALWKHDFKVPFVCGCRDLGEALRRIAEGAAMIRTKGEAGTGNIVEAVRHMRAVMDEMRKIKSMTTDELTAEAKALGASLELVTEVHETGKLPVVNFAAGGIATPADAALMMQLGAEGVFVGSGIFKASDPEQRARAIVKATTHYRDPEIIAEVSKGLGAAMPGIDIKTIPQDELLAPRGW